jgi:hypothetical protein
MNGQEVCPFCDCQVTHGGVEFGGSFLHDECYAKLQTEMDEASMVIESTLEENYENVEHEAA